MKFFFTSRSGFLYRMILAAAFFVAVVPSAVHAGNISGWAWSDMPNGSDELKTFGQVGRGAGWIEFAPAMGPGVTVDPSGNFSGYAWSERIGWVSFNASETSSCGSNATLNKLTGAVTGFAKALGGNDSQAGGWDGCIKMDPGVFGSGVSVDASCNYRGWAWGGPIIGWVQFDPVFGGVKGAGDACVSGLLSASCSVSPASATVGQSVTWTATASGGTGSYSYSWSGSSPLAGQTGNPVTVSYATAGTKTGAVTVTSGAQTSSLQACNTSVDIAAGASVPLAPSLLRVDSASLNTCGAIRVLWNDNSDNEDRFELERDNGFGFANIANLAANATSFTDTTVSQNTGYVYRVRACNAVGCSAYSNSATGNNQSPSADFTWVPQQPKVNQPTVFTDTSTPFGGATIILRRWTFENGNPATTTSSRATTTTRFVNATPPNKTSTLAVTDSLSRTCSMTKSVSVTEDTNGDWCELPPDSLPGTPCP
ncbi:fibronectin type III domain-containing protein [Patescibacteria group bacterium]|nr:fibronectin type III domain-containing protein [Patescibacteria group bacterium]